MRGIYLYGIIFLFLLFGQIIAGRIDYTFRHNSLQQGLSQSTINCIVQDKQGFIWMGTENGLNRYDGYRFLSFLTHAGDTSGISDNYIHALALDSAQNLWVATHNGLSRLDLISGRFTNFFLNTESGLSDFLDVKADSENRLYLITRQALFRFDPQKKVFGKIRFSPGYPGKIIFRKLWIHGKDLYIGTNRGMWVYDRNKNIISSPGIKQTEITAIFSKSANSVWIGTRDARLFKYMVSGKRLIEYPEIRKNISGGITALEIDSSGFLWIGTEFNGLYRFNPANRKLLTIPVDTQNPTALNNIHIRSLFIDPEGVLFVGTEGSGINMTLTYNKGFVRYRICKSDAHNSDANMIFSFAQDADNKVWIGGWGGVYRLDPQTEGIKFFPIVSTSHSQKTLVWSLLIDRSGRLLVGSKGKGLYYLDRKKNQCLRFPSVINSKSNLGSKSVYAMVEDQDGFIWLGTSAGLYRYREKGHGKPGISVFLKDRLVRTLYQDDKGYIWAGSLKEGLFRLNPVTLAVKQYKQNRSETGTLSNNMVYAITEDHKGYIWVGTGGGLNRFNSMTQRFEYLPRDLNRRVGTIYSIGVDSRDRLWLGTSRGLVFVKPKRAVFDLYTEFDGLQGNEFNVGAVLKARNGEFYFGGINGFNRFNPLQIRKNRHIPHIQITDFKFYKNGHTIHNTLGHEALIPSLFRLNQPDAVLKLAYDENFFRIEFTALDFTLPEKNQYVYGLTGVDSKLKYVREQTFAEYTNIPPGEYIFTVKGSNNDRVWNKVGHSIKIIITPPIWATIWFRLTGIFLVVLIIFVLYKRRTRMIRQRNLELKIINDRLNSEVEERKKAQQELQESQRKLTTLIENLPGIAYRCAYDQKRSIEFVSKGSYILTGYKPEDLIARKDLFFTRIVHAEDRANILAAIEKAVDQKKPFQIVYRIQTGFGITRWVWEQGRGIMDSQGKVQAVEGFITDITDRKQLEEQLAQSQKMEAIGQLAGGVAHDFNNLLTIIRGYTELSLLLLNKKHKAYPKIEEITRAVDRAEALTRQLLMFSRKQVIQPKVINLNNLIREEEKILHRVIGEDIELKAFLEAKPAAVKMDPAQMEQVILNMAINARDAMPGGGKLTIRTQNAHMDDDFSGKSAAIKSGNYVLMTMSDTGQGMDEATMNKIFDPFFTTKEKGKGTGLGLATVYGIIEQNNGYIMVNSQLSVGTTFFIYLPQEKEPLMLDGDPQGIQQKLHGNEGILLVEDRKKVRGVISESLQQYGYRVLEAGDGKEAFEVWKNHKSEIDLIVTDVIMPNMNGRELVNRIQKDKQSINAIFMSGYTDDTLGEEGKLDPGIVFIQKPFAQADLVYLIRKVLDEK